MKKKFLFVPALLGASLLASTPSLAQDKTIKMTTEKEMGSTITLLVNHNSKGVTVDWGDGTPVTYTTNKAEGISAIEGTVKGKTIVVSGGNNWNMLSCANCGISEIDLSQANSLRSLYCQDNLLTTLNLKGMNALVDLNCSNNQISKLVFTHASDPKADLASIETLNMANNQLRGRYMLKLPLLQYLDISHNQYEIFNAYETQLKSLDCSHNALTKLDLSKCTALNNVICHNNDLESLTLANGGEYARQVVCDYNQITNLNLENAEQLIDFSCSNNEMGMVTFHKKVKTSTLNVSGNKLNFSVLPAKNNAPDYMRFEPQAPFDLAGAEGMKKKGGVPYAPISEDWAGRTYVNLKPYCSLSNGRVDAEYTWYSAQTDGSWKELTRRKYSTGDEDFYFTNGEFAFFTPQKKAYVKFTSKSYGYVIESLPIAIGDDITGIDRLISDQEGCQIGAAKGMIFVKTNAAMPVQVFTMDGKCVWQDTVSGEVSISLPQGAYIINGKKVLL